jgi:hypothetical protein
MARELQFPQALYERGQYGFFDDFLYLFATAWGSLGTAAIANLEPIGTVLAITTAGTIESEADIYGVSAPFLPAPGRVIHLETCLQFAQGSVNNAEIAFGLTSLATGAGLMQAAGAGPIASGSQILMYTVKGDANWHAQARNGTTVSDSGSQTPAPPDANSHILTIEVKDIGSGAPQCVVTFAVDGVRLKPAQTILANTYPDLSFLLPLAGLARMRPVLYVRSGAANVETVNADYFGGWQVRAGNPGLFGTF